MLTGKEESGEGWFGDSVALAGNGEACVSVRGGGVGGGVGGAGVAAMSAIAASIRTGYFTSAALRGLASESCECRAEV